MNMKRLITLLSLLVAFESFAGSPSFSTFSNSTFTVSQSGNSISVLSSPTATNSAAVSNSFVKILGVIGATNPFIKINATNVIINSNRFHITETAGSPFLISTDGVFAGMRSGFQVEPANGSAFDQLIITKVLSPTQAVAIAATIGYPSFAANTVNNNTNFQIRQPVATISDDTIGSDNNGSWVDENGMWWLSAINDQGTLYFINPVNSTIMTLGVATEGSVGLNTGLGNVIIGISGMVTNTTQSAQPLIWYVDSAAPNESFGILPNGLLAIGGGSGIGSGFTNRHPVIGNYVDIWNGLRVTNKASGNFTSISNGIIITTGVINGDGSGITNFALAYRTNVINPSTNVNTSQRVETWKIPAFATEPAATLGNAEIDAQVQRSDGVWMTLSKVDIAGGATSILQTNKENLVFDVYSGESWRLTNSTSGTGYTAGLDATSTNSVTRY